MAGGPSATEGFSRALLKLSKLQEGLSNIPQILESRVGPELLRRVLSRFDREVDADGNPWVPFAARRAETTHRDSQGRRWGPKKERATDPRYKRGRFGSGDKLLNETGALRRSLSMRVRRYGKYHTKVILYSKDKRHTKSGVPLTQIHQDPDGQRTHRRLIPERRFLDLSKRDRQWARNEVRRALLGN